MFSKPNQHQHQHQHAFQFSGECEDDNSQHSGGLIDASAQKSILAGNSDEATIEVVRRPRGRPPGSKNRPKPPLIIAQECEPTMSPFILEVPGGSDVVEVLARFSRRKNTGLCVLTGSGTVANVTLRQPSATPGATVTFHGRFDVLSMSATFLLSAPGANGFSISIAGPQGQVVGGLIGGRLLAAGTVFVIAALLNNPLYHRLTSVEEEVRNNSVGGGGDSQSPAGSGGGAESGHVTGEAMYSCQLPSDVIWAPTARQVPF
ncbi:hypothetical protein RJT34_11973 [Clitoria ternatea]|uniref:AT-hook motif nuclear-localized protein n=1 Tax=Clitoria ternatea TaxID=43366 RepID=A0AAN9PKY5_CLITE